MMLCYHIISIFIILMTFGYGSNLYFSGYIYNQAGEKLEGANIVAVDSKGDEIGTYSDRDGYFKLPIISNNDYEIAITFIGYNDYYKSISFVGQDYTNQVIILETQSIPLEQLEIIIGVP